MTGVDTNIIVRLLTGDDPAQTEKTTLVFRKSNLFIADTVLLESEWVLRHAYGFSPMAIHEAFTKLCGLPNVALSNPRRIMLALQWYAGGLDFAEWVHKPITRTAKKSWARQKRLALTW